MPAQEVIYLIIVARLVFMVAFKLLNWNIQLLTDYIAGLVDIIFYKLYSDNKFQLPDQPCVGTFISAHLLGSVSYQASSNIIFFWLKHKAKI